MFVFVFDLGTGLGNWTNFLGRTYIQTCYVRTYIHTHTHTYIHTCKHTYIHPCVHTYKQTYVHVYVHEYIYTLVHIHTYICIRTGLCRLRKSIRQYRKQIQCHTHWNTFSWRKRIYHQLQPTNNLATLFPTTRTWRMHRLPPQRLLVHVHYLYTRQIQRQYLQRQRQWCILARANTNRKI